MRAPASFDVVEYAELTATLADPSCDRAALLAAHDLDEDGWSALDRHFQERLGRAMDEATEGVPPLISAYAEAFARARESQRTGKVIISIERFGDATREIARTGDPKGALTRLGLTLEEFLRANEHWTQKMLADPALLARYRKRLGQI